MEFDPIDLLFGGMRKLAPGDDAYTLQVLRSLPNQEFDLVVDAGCGAGRQTLVLAEALKTTIHALDTYQPFLKTLTELAIQEGVNELVKTHCMDIANIPTEFKNIDLLWSEGAAYNIGFSNALSCWAAAMKPGGFVVVSELCWLTSSIPERVKAFFSYEYPDMKAHDENIQIAEASGYRVLDTVLLPQNTWVEGYYDVLEPRAKSLLDHADSSVRAFAQEMLKEIEVFQISEGSYGYVFYVLQLAE